MDILFVCTGNICRSPMAEGLFRYMLPPETREAVHVHSAGTHGLDGEPAAPFAVQAAAAMGLILAVIGRAPCTLKWSGKRMSFWSWNPSIVIS